MGGGGTGVNSGSKLRRACRLGNREGSNNRLSLSNEPRKTEEIGKKSEGGGRKGLLSGEDRGLKRGPESHFFVPK